MIATIILFTGLLVVISIANNKLLRTIMATQEEAAATLSALKDQLTKANGEIQAKIQALIDAANAADTVNPTLQAAIDDLKPAAQALDDIVPDV